MKPAIRVENLAKCYKVGIGRMPAGSRTLRETVTDLAAAPLRRWRDKGMDRSEPFWALNDINFEVQPGEVVGFIGRNGAGKSTLLKILSRITKPSRGRVELYGRVGSLLEVGTGFHPELTGRDNVFLNGSILGMSRKEIGRRFDEIVAFAEVEKFLDTPVKRYSSGMYVRLAFAVAAHLDPDILIVDEVLAVGDHEFQKKCLGRMQNVGREGRTVLFVSHNHQAVAQLTSRCLLMRSGGLVFDGPTREALALYTGRGESVMGQLPEYSSPEGGSGNCVRAARVETSQGSRVHEWGKSAAFEFDLDISEPSQTLCFSFNVVDVDGRRVTHFWQLGEGPWRRAPGLYRLRLRTPKLRLYRGEYTLTTWLSEKRSGKIYENLDGICRFEVTMEHVPRQEYDWEPGEAVYLEDGDWEAAEIGGGAA